MASTTPKPSPALPRGLALADIARQLYVAPADSLSGPAADAALIAQQGWSLAGGPLAFAQCSLLWREEGDLYEASAPFGQMLDWSESENPELATHVGALLSTIGRRRPAFAGLALDRPRLMGVVNVTPNSFSDGGRFLDSQAAIAHGLALLAAGADILDVGGESTHPTADPVGPEEELRRVLPVIRALAEKGAVVSIDTRHAAVMGAAVEAGARIINYVSALEGEPESLTVAARSGAAVILMHMQGDPITMQSQPRYDYAPLDVYDYLAQRLMACRAAGIPMEKLCLDPGIGFGKTDMHNLQILSRLGLYHALGAPLLLGVSRKSFIARVSRGEPPEARLAGSLTAALAGLNQGVQILRVHDVAETAQAVAIWQGLHGASRSQ